MESLSRLEIHIPLSNLLEVTFSVSILFELHIEHDAIQKPLVIKQATEQLE